jgi:hypothetical protein
MPSFTGRLALLGWALCLLPSCVDGSTADAPVLGSNAAGTAGSAGASGSAGQASGGEMSVGGGAGVAGQPSAGSPSVEPVDCSSFVEHSTWSLLVQIKNEMTQTLYVGQPTTSCEPKRLFKVEDGARTELPSLDGCHTSCQTMMQSGPTTCPTVCTTPSTVTLQPGQTIQIPWDGRFGVEHSLPAQCLQAGALAPATCVQAQRIEANAFTFSAQAGTHLECLQPGGTCTCTMNANGGCTSAGSTIGGTIYTSEYFVKLEPGEPSPSGEPPYIGILFRDEMQ